MANVKSIINMHNKEVIMEKKTQAVNCNCMNKPDCPLSNQCQIMNRIHNTKITSNLQNYHGKIYYGTREGTFKQQYGNHKKSFKHKKHRTDTELWNEYWRLKELKTQPSPSQIACMVTTVHVTSMQTTLHVHENACTVLIENTTENYLLPAHTDHYALRK